MDGVDVILIILFGLGVIIFGYWFKAKTNSCYSNPYGEETIQQLREKQKIKEKLTFNEGFTLWLLDGNGVKLFNKIGFTIIIIGIILLILNAIINK